MSEESRGLGAGSQDDLFERALQIELVKRIDAVSAYSDEDFGRISGWEWTIFVIVGLLLPGICVWWAA